MTRIGLGVIGLLLLGACGVDGPPVRPSLGATIGVGSHGVHTSVHTGARVGGVNVGVGVGL
jgi:hypothetical protein